MIEIGIKQPNFETMWQTANAFEIAPYEFVELIEKEAANPESKDEDWPILYTNKRKVIDSC